MANAFLKIDKRLYDIGLLEPLGMMIVSSILEYQRQNRECYITDESFAEWFHVSKSTITRALGKMEKQGFISRKSKGKNRLLVVNMEALEQDMAQNDYKAFDSQNDYKEDYSQNDAIRQNEAHFDYKGDSSQNDYKVENRHDIRQDMAQNDCRSNKNSRQFDSIKEKEKKEKELARAIPDFW